MCTRDRHRRGVHLDDAIAVGAVLALVLAGARLRTAASLRHAQPAGALSRW